MIAVLRYKKGIYYDVGLHQVYNLIIETWEVKR